MTISRYIPPSFIVTRYLDDTALKFYNNSAFCHALTRRFHARYYNSCRLPLGAFGCGGGGKGRCRGAFLTCTLQSDPFFDLTLNYGILIFYSGR